MSIGEHEVVVIAELISFEETGETIVAVSLYDNTKKTRNVYYYVAGSNVLEKKRENATRLLSKDTADLRSIQYQTALRFLKTLEEEFKRSFRLQMIDTIEG